MDSTLFLSLGTQMENLSSGDNIILLEAKLKQELKPWQIENGKVAFINYLYELFDRRNAKIGLRNTYSGLWQQLEKLCEIEPDLPKLVQLHYILNSHAKGKL